MQHLPNLFHLFSRRRRVGVSSCMNTMERREMEAVMFITLRVKGLATVSFRKDSSQRKGSYTPTVMNFSKIALYS